MFSQYNIEMQARARQADIQRDAQRGRRYTAPGWAPPGRTTARNPRLAVALGSVVVAVLLAGLLLAVMTHAGAGLPLPL